MKSASLKKYDLYPLHKGMKSAIIYRIEWFLFTKCKCNALSTSSIPLSTGDGNMAQRVPTTLETVYNLKAHLAYPKLLGVVFSPRQELNRSIVFAINFAAISDIVRF